MLAWAIQESGYHSTEFADAVGVDSAILKMWLGGELLPGLTQVRKFSSVLRRPTATFLLPEPPKGAAPAVQFRHPPGREERALSPAERLRLREAVRLQRGLRWVSDELREVATRLPELRAPQDDAEAAGRSFRERLKVTIKTQTGWKNEHAAFRGWRDLVEGIGVVVLALPMGSDAARGFSVWDERVPVVAINTHWNACARIFTLFHELGHLVSRTSSVCEEDFSGKHKAKGDPVERWCESFAAAVLVPWSDAEQYLAARYGWDGTRRIVDLAIASALARRYRVSLRASVLRLISREAADWPLYNAIPKTSEQKPSGGGGGGGRSRPEARRDEYGSRTASIFRRGLEREVLGRDDVLGYLNIGDAELSSFLSPVPGK